MRVKIVKCKYPGWWYEDRIGEEFEVEERVSLTFGEPSYKLAGYEFDRILKEDCEVVTDTSPVDLVTIQECKDIIFRLSAILMRSCIETRFKVPETTTSTLQDAATLLTRIKD